MSNKRKKSPAGRVSDTERKQHGRPHRKVRWLVVMAVALIALIAVSGLLKNENAAVASPIEFTDVRENTKEYIGFYNSIELTPEQKLIKREALSAIKAPCCSDNSAYTCCCPCNMAKSWWGLAHHLIVDEGYGADQVQAAVEGWIDFIGPKGFSGDACSTGGCGRAFHRNGCGGMSESKIVF